MSSEPMNHDLRHAALWLVGPDMPGLLNLNASFVAERGGNIDHIIAHKFGEHAVIFTSLTADPASIQQMDDDKLFLKRKSGCNVKFQPMTRPTVPEGFQPDLHGFDLVTKDVKGLIADVTKVLTSHGILIVGHMGERRLVPGPRKTYQFGQKYVVLLPHDFDLGTFTRDIHAIAQKYGGSIKSPLAKVPGMLWWW